MVRIPFEIPLEVEVSKNQFDLEVENSTNEIDIGVATQIVLAYPDYTGALTIVPTQERQVLNTNLTSMHGDIIVEPIPQNYGLIEWNGSFLTVS